MLCCGKSKKKKVKGDSAISHTNNGFVDENFKEDKYGKGGGGEAEEDMGLNTSVVEETGMGDNVNGQGCEGPSRGRRVSVERLKSILQTEDKTDDKPKRRETGRRRSVSFSLPEEDIPVVKKDQEVQSIPEEEEQKKLKSLDKSSMEKDKDMLVASSDLSVIDRSSRESDDYTLTENTQSIMSNQVPAITKPAPVFEGTAVVDGQFKEISLKDYRGKYVVFFFYPLDFTFVCPTEIIAFSERVQDFKKIGCEVIACSTDSHFSHLAWVNTPRKQGGLGAMNIPLLADKSMNIAKAYGVLKEDDGVAFRGLFIIDTKGNLRQATINDLPVGRDVDETLRLVQAFQFTDEHGEVCPAGWKPGSKTMKADPTGSLEYFQTEN